METKKFMTFLIIAIAIVSVMITFKTAERVAEDKNQKELAGNESNNRDNNQELPTLKPGSESTGGISESGGGAGTAGTGSMENRTDIPSDINTQPCGHYFSEYGVCAGACPAGTCQQIEKSCYCILSR